MRLDIIIWNHAAMGEMIAVPVTSRGCTALNNYIRSVADAPIPDNNDFIGLCPLEVGPEEFTRNIPSNVGIFLYSEETSVLVDVRSVATYPLQ